MSGERFYEEASAGPMRSAPAALRNRQPIAAVLEDWLPEDGLVLELASGTGEHAVYFAKRFPQLEWQPSDIDPGALASINAWRLESQLPNLRVPIVLDAAAADWPVDSADAILCINMAHISPWDTTLGVLDHAAKLLPPGGPLIFYGPWLRSGVATAPSNLQFDSDLRRRNETWGIRKVETLEAEARARGMQLGSLCEMPANNLIMQFKPTGVMG